MVGVASPLPRRGSRHQRATDRPDGPGRCEAESHGSRHRAGQRVQLADVADAVIAGLETRLLRAPRSLDGALLEQVDRYDWLRDRRARLTLPGDEAGQPGTCVGIAPDGALLFRPDRGALRRVTDGVVDPWA